MHQVKKGNEWYFGMKVHSGCDALAGYVHTITATSANEHDITETHKLIREDDEVVYGDSGYLGIEKRDEIKNDEHLSKVEYRIAMRPSALKSKLKNGGKNFDREIERRKASVRSKIEWPHLVVKRIFGYCKCVYKGIKKNLNRFYILFASVNLLKVIWGGRTAEFCAVVSR
jgi:IS5 family transposase